MKTAKETDFLKVLQRITETLLTRRNRRRRIKKEKQKAKNPFLDWIEAFLWAAGMVLLINQYFFQAYQIPSGSMIDTLLIKDHIFVNKILYGPELLPGLGKLPSPIKPQRNEIIIFENPAYISRGPVFDIAQRIIYMLTLSLVDIDRDESGKQKAHFLIKRAAAAGGDRIIFDKGNLKLRFSGEDRWVNETEYNAERNWTHNITRLIDDRQYTALIAAGQAAAWSSLKMPVPPRLTAIIQEGGNLSSLDTFAIDKARLETLRKAMPDDSRNRILLTRQNLGWYIPEGRVMPLGDNRDSSKDGRYFGPVKITKILGRGSFIYWPLARIHGIK